MRDRAPGGGIDGMGVALAVDLEEIAVVPRGRHRAVARPHREHRRARRRIGTLEADAGYPEVLFSVFDGPMTLGLFEDYRLDVVPRVPYITLEPVSDLTPASAGRLGGKDP